MSHASIYDPNSVWTSIFEQMAEGKSLSAILKQEGYPSYSWYKQKIRDATNFVGNKIPLSKAEARLHELPRVKVKDVIDVASKQV